MKVKKDEMMIELGGEEMDTGGEGGVVLSLDINMNVYCAGISQK